MPSTVIINQVPVALYDECGNKVLISQEGNNLSLSVKSNIQEELLAKILKQLEKIEFHLSQITNHSFDTTGEF